ncbi:MAG: hypothetical protein M3Y48_23940 [Actinomycetota bacterium]|nr:hypothetical protein [Actinomycetota bacterium]
MDAAEGLYSVVDHSDCQPDRQVLIGLIGPPEVLAAEAMLGNGVRRLQSGRRRGAGRGQLDFARQ